MGENFLVTTCLNKTEKFLVTTYLNKTENFLVKTRLNKTEFLVTTCLKKTEILSHTLIDRQLRYVVGYFTMLSYHVGVVQIFVKIFKQFTHFPPSNKFLFCSFLYRSHIC
jgi:trehalose utilization protein